MVDRFAGFRYEIIGTLADVPALALEVRDRADEMAAFGWAQVTDRETLVGEFRGTPATAEQFRQFLAKGHSQASGVDRVEVRPYPDTKIRYHFSYFKVVDPRRRTCFEDAPHACAAVPNTTPSSGSTRPAHGEL